MIHTHTHRQDPESYSLQITNEASYSKVGITNLYTMNVSGEEPTTVSFTKQNFMWDRYNEENYFMIKQSIS
jgi:hypothetical protein